MSIVESHLPFLFASKQIILFVIVVIVVAAAAVAIDAFVSCPGFVSNFRMNPIG